jgi:hypothetical protein
MPHRARTHRRAFASACSQAADALKATGRSVLASGQLVLHNGSPCTTIVKTSLHGPARPLRSITVERHHGRDRRRDPMENPDTEADADVPADDTAETAQQETDSGDGVKVRWEAKNLRERLKASETRPMSWPADCILNSPAPARSWPTRQTFDMTQPPGRRRQPRRSD